jgi:hypothetical protein
MIFEIVYCSAGKIKFVYIVAKNILKSMNIFQARYGKISYILTIKEVKSMKEITIGDALDLNKKGYEAVIENGEVVAFVKAEDGYGWERKKL